MLNFTRRDGSIVQYKRECHINLTNDEYGELCSNDAQLIARWENKDNPEVERRMPLTIRDGTDRSEDYPCYIKKTNNDKRDKYEIIIISDQFIYQKEASEETGFIIHFSLRKGDIYYQDDLFSYSYINGEEPLLEVPEYSLYRFVNKMNGNFKKETSLKEKEEKFISLLDSPEEYTACTRTTLYKRKFVTMIGSETEYFGVPKTVEFGKILPSDPIFSFEYSKTTKVADRDPYDFYSEIFSIGGKELLRINTDKKECRFLNVFTRSYGKIRIEYDPLKEFGFIVVIDVKKGNERIKQRRNITVKELKDLYDTFQFMDDMRSATKDCNGGKIYYDLVFLCRAFFSLYPELLREDEKDNLELTYQNFEKLKKISILKQDIIQKSKSIDEIRTTLFLDDNSSDFKIVRLLDIKRKHVVLGIVPRDPSKKVLIFDSSYQTRFDDIEINMPFLTKEESRLAPEERETLFKQRKNEAINRLKEYAIRSLRDRHNIRYRYVNLSKLFEINGGKEIYEKVILLNDFPIQKNGTCWAWSTAAGLAALEYDTYEDIVRAASTVLSFGIDEFTAKAIEKLKGITDIELAKKTESEMLESCRYGPHEEYTIPVVRTIESGIFGQEHEHTFIPQKPHLHSLFRILMEELEIPQNKWITLYQEKKFNSQQPEILTK